MLDLFPAMAEAVPGLNTLPAYEVLKKLAVESVDLALAN